MPKADLDSELLAAATALDEELGKFERLTEKLRSSPFASQKSLEKAADTLRQLSESDQELGRRVASMVQAITSARERQQKQAELVEARALELQQRTLTYQQLMEGYGVVGGSARQLHDLLSKLVGNQAPRRTPEFEEGLRELLRGLLAVAAAAKDLAERAGDEGFSDVERLADGLRQQILAAMNKVKVLARQLGIPEQAEA